MKRFDINYDDALSAAERFAEENKGWIPRSGRIVDDRTSFDEYGSDDAMNLCWSGEVNAIVVLNDDGQEIGIFAYWE